MVRIWDASKEHLCVSLSSYNTLCVCPLSFSRSRQLVSRSSRRAGCTPPTCVKTWRHNRDLILSTTPTPNHLC